MKVKKSEEKWWSGKSNEDIRAFEEMFVECYIKPVKKEFEKDNTYLRWLWGI